MLRKRARDRVLISILLTLGACQIAYVAPAVGAASKQTESFKVDHDADEFTTTITIRSRGGFVDWADVLRGISRARGFDDSALDGIGPWRSLPIEGPIAAPVIAAINVALSPKVRLAIARGAAAPEHPNLEIRLDREALLASQRRLKQILRGKLASRYPSSRRFGLQLDDGWSRTAADKQVVILIHGLQGNGVAIDSLLSRPQAAGFPCGKFEYPNDQPIADSARLLSRELRRFGQRHADRKMTLLTHSMGGLVARAALEDPRLDPGNVRQLIMVSPPNHGSILANFGYGFDIHEYLLGARREETQRFFAAIEDGLADAQRDLRPASPFLTNLNARERNPEVAYTVLLGNRAPLQANELKAVRESVRRAGEANRWARFFGAKFESWLADLDEVVDGFGDGAVAVKRGQLEGVDDTVVLPFGHLSFNRPINEDSSRVLDEIMNRLRDAD